MGNWHLHGGELRCEAFETDLRAALAESQRIYLATTAFAPAHLLDATEERRLASHRRLQHRRGPAASNDARASCLEKSSMRAPATALALTPLGSSPSTASKSSRSNLMDRLTEAGHSLTRQDFAVAAARASSVQIARHPRTEASACCCISTSPTARAALRSKPKNLAALCDDGLVLVGREHAVGPCGCFA